MGLLGSITSDGGEQLERAESLGQMLISPEVERVREKGDLEEAGQGASIGKGLGDGHTNGI